MSASKNNIVLIGLAGLMLSGSLADLVNVLQGGVVNESVETFFDIVGLILFLSCLPELFKSEANTIAFSTFLVGALWWLSGFLNSQNVPYLKEQATQFFLYVLPYYWIGSYLVKKGMFLNGFLQIARWKFILSILAQVFIILQPSRDIFGGDYMNAANALIVGLISVSFLAYRDKKWYDIVGAIAGTVVLFMNGSRGVFLSLVLFWVLILIYNGTRNIKSMIASTVVVLLVVTISGPLLDLLSSLAQQSGVSTHLTDALGSDEGLFYDDNRTYLFINFWQAILEKPLFGYGIMGDRAISESFAYKPIYPHNIFLELSVDFGLVFGVIVMLVFLIAVLKGLISRNPDFKFGVIVLFCSCFVKLLVSSSLWQDQMFFMLLGFLLAGSIMRRKKVLQI